MILIIHFTEGRPAGTNDAMFPDPRQMSADEWMAFRHGIEARVRIERENAIRALWRFILKGRATMTKGYWIVRVSVADVARYPEYLKKAKPAFEKFGAKFLVRGGRFQATEGRARERNVVVEFDNYDTAVACYYSPEYQRAKEIRYAAAEADFIIVEGAA